MFSNRKKNIYDIDYLLEEDVNDKKPNFEKLEKLTPYLSKDKALAYTLFSLQNVSDEVKEYYKNNAKKTIDDYNNKYSHLLEIMETKSYQ